MWHNYKTAWRNFDFPPVYFRVTIAISFGPGVLKGKLREKRKKKKKSPSVVTKRLLWTVDDSLAAIQLETFSGRRFSRNHFERGSLGRAAPRNRFPPLEQPWHNRRRALKRAEEEDRASRDTLQSLIFTQRFYDDPSPHFYPPPPRPRGYFANSKRGTSLNRTPLAVPSVLFFSSRQHTARLVVQNGQRKVEMVHLIPLYDAVRFANT